MTRITNFNPNMVVVDTKTGRLTRDGYLLFRAVVDFALDDSSDPVLVDVTQTLTNKTIDGDANTLRDIGTTSLKSRTGDGTRVATGSAGAAGNLAAWDSDGNVVDAEAAIPDLAQQNAVQLLSKPVQLLVYTVATVPDATTEGQVIFVRNETGGATAAVSDGTNWLRTSDGAVVS